MDAGWRKLLLVLGTVPITLLDITFQDFTEIFKCDGYAAMLASAATAAAAAVAAVKMSLAAIEAITGATQGQYDFGIVVINCDGTGYRSQGL